MSYSSQIEVILEDYCQTATKEATDINSRYAELWREIQRYLMAGGKRMRPRLVMLAYDAYKEEASSSQDILPIAAAWELLHACLLVHDDIIDRDTVRHGQPNIAGRYQKIYDSLGAADTPHYSMSAALLAGDLLLMSAFDIIRSSAVNDHAKLLAQKYLNKATFAVAGGELIDTDSALYSIDDSDPLSVAMHKTASYSLQMPLQCGAALAGANHKELDKLAQAGLHAGIAYQLQDDLLGIFGNSNITGKSNRSDIFEKKRTYLIHTTLGSLSKTDSDRLSDILSLHHIVSKNEAEEVINFINSSGAKDIIIDRINSESDQALKIIASLDIDNRSKGQFSELINKLTTRTS